HRSLGEVGQHRQREQVADLAFVRHGCSVYTPYLPALCRRVVDRGPPALAVGATRVGEELAGEQGGQDGDAAAVHPDLAAAQLTGEHDAPAGPAGGLNVLHPATRDAAQLPVVDDHVL